jgi:hypothetical protein
MADYQKRYNHSPKRTSDRTLWRTTHIFRYKRRGVIRNTINSEKQAAGHGTPLCQKDLLLPIPQTGKRPEHKRDQRCKKRLELTFVFGQIKA